MGLFAIVFIGFIAGLIARAIAPGAQRMGLVGTTLLGIVGSLVGGLVGSIISSDGRWLEFRPSGLLMSVLGALVVLALQGLGQRARV